MNKLTVVTTFYNTSWDDFLLEQLQDFWYQEERSSIEIPESERLVVPEDHLLGTKHAIEKILDEYFGVSLEGGVEDFSTLMTFEQFKALKEKSVPFRLNFLVKDEFHLKEVIGILKTFPVSFANLIMEGWEFDPETGFSKPYGKDNLLNLDKKFKEFGGVVNISRIPTCFLRAEKH